MERGAAKRRAAAAVGSRIRARWDACRAHTDLDGNPLTGECGCEYACTPTAAEERARIRSTPSSWMTTRDGGDGLVEQCIYVSASTGDDASSGTRNAPVETIAKAIQVAQAARVPAVCLSGELYQEAVTVVSGISIYGGFDHANADFKFRRTSSVTTTVRATGTVFHAPSIAQPTHIEGISIEALSPSSAGASTYGVRLGGGTADLFVRFNQINVEEGRAGAAGTNGAAHAAGTATSGNAGEQGLQRLQRACGGMPARLPPATSLAGEVDMADMAPTTERPGHPGSRGAAGGAGGAPSRCSDPARRDPMAHRAWLGRRGRRGRGRESRQHRLGRLPACERHQRATGNERRRRRRRGRRRRRDVRL